MAEHPGRSVVERFTRGEATPEEGRQVLRHLLGGCERCREAARGAVLAFDEPEVPRIEPDLGQAFDRILATVREREGMLARERYEASGLVAELSRHPVLRQLTMIRNSRKYSTWALCEALVEEAKEGVFDDPRQALERAEAAAAVAERLDEERYRERLVADLKARAYSYLGNNRRVCGELREADEALARAREELEAGTGDPLEAWIVYAHFGALRRDQRRFDESIRWYNRAIRTCNLIGETENAARAMTAKANTLFESGKLDKAISLLRKVLEIVDPKEEPRLVLAAQHNLVLYLHEAGRLAEAKTMLAKIRPVYRQRGERMNLLRLRWVEGKIASDEGRLEAAEEAFGEVKAGFLEHDLAYDAALVSLDLAAVFAKTGRTRETKELAAEMLAVFRSRQIHREAIAALLVFQQAAERERVTADLLRRVAAFLERVQKDPAAKFRAKA